MKRVLFLIVIAACATAPRLSMAQTSDEVARKLVIGTRHVPPFVIKGENGTWDGISMDLWRKIAAENHWNYELREMNLRSVLGAVENGELDAAVAALTVTHEREAALDFSHPFYSSGLGIAVRKAYHRNWLAGLWQLLAWELLTLIGLLAGMTIFFGLLIWLFERRRNPEHFGGVVDGFGQGIWWAVVTMTTVGYGDKAPRTLPGRMVAVLWMMVGVVSLAIFTGSVASQLTVTQLSNPINGPDDLTHVRTGTVEATTSEAYLQQRGISFQCYPTDLEALKALTNREIDAVVYDAPTLRYAVDQTMSGLVEVLPVRFQRQEYAIALPLGSRLRKPINLSLTKMVLEPAWEDAVQRYMGR